MVYLHQVFKGELCLNILIAFDDEIVAPIRKIVTYLNIRRVFTLSCGIMVSKLVINGSDEQTIRAKWQNLTTTGSSKSTGKCQSHLTVG